MREIIFNINNLKAEPQLQWGGVENEHNATAVSYKIDRKYYDSLGTDALFRIDFSSVGAGYDPSQNLVPDENLTVTRTIPKKFTQFGGKMVATLVISILKDNQVQREEISVPSEIFFTSVNQDNGEIITNLSACEQYILSLVKKAEQLVETAENIKIDVNDEINNIKSDVDFCVKKDQFADSMGNAGILRINTGSGLSSAKFNASSPESGDSIVVQTASDQLIKERTQKYMPITPSNIDYAVKCALTDPKISWTESEKEMAKEFLGIEKTWEYLINNQVINRFNEYSVKVSQPLISGQKYVWMYYASEFPGWVVDDPTRLPEDSMQEIVSYAGPIEVNGNTYIGFTVSCLYWAFQDRSTTIIVYYDEGYIKVLTEFGGDTDLITIKK